MSNRFISLKELQKEVFEVYDHVIPGILPVGANVLTADPGVGKTWLALGWAIAVATGGKALGAFQTQPGHVLYIGPDETRMNLQDRAGLLLGEDGNWPDNISIADEWPRLDQGGLQELDQAITDYPSTKLVILDTLGTLRKPGSQNVSQYDSEKDAVIPLKELANRRRVAILAIHHNTKGKHENPKDDIGGSYGLIGSFQHRMILRQIDTDTFSLCQWGKLLPERTLILNRDEGCRYTYVHDEGQQAYGSGKTAQVDGALLSIGRVATVAEVAKEAQLTEKETGVYLGRLMGAGRAYKRERGQYIHVNAGRPATPAAPPYQPPTVAPTPEQAATLRELGAPEWFIQAGHKLSAEDWDKEIAEIRSEAA